MNATAHHVEAVQAISDRIKHFHSLSQPFRIYHGTSNSTRVLNFDRDRIIDTSSLNHVLHVDTERNVCIAEPNVSMDVLVAETLKHGLIPQVVMELPGITVGGGFSGTSGESSSFRYGFFEDTVDKIEIVLGDGTVVEAQRDGERQDLLKAAGGSFGSLGVVTRLEVSLTTARTYMRLEVRPASTVKQTLEMLEEATEEKTTEYVDGILFGRDLGVVMVGNLTDDLDDKENIPVVRFTRARDQWFYRYIEKRLSKNGVSNFTIAIPIFDYFFRYDRGAFWGGKWAYKYFKMPFNRVTRFVLDPLMYTKVMFHAFHVSGLGNQNIVQDIGFPKSTVGAFIDFIDKELGIWPLWLCPLRKGHELPLRPTGSTEEGNRALREELLINVGIWGPGAKKEIDFVKQNREIERETRELSGGKCLYARAFYTEEEFWTIYDRQLYDTMRDKYHAGNLPTIFDKVKIDLDAVERRAKEDEKRKIPRLREIWPLAGVYGASKALMGLYSKRSREYIIAKRQR